MKPFRFPAHAALLGQLAALCAGMLPLMAPPSFAASAASAPVALHAASESPAAISPTAAATVTAASAQAAAPETAASTAPPPTPATPTAPTTPHEHSAWCVSALTSQAEPLAARLKAGDETVEKELLGLTERGFALIGAAYKDGLRKDDGERLLDAARKAQKNLPPADLAKLRAGCLTEGSHALSNFNALERFLVTNAARRRVDRIIDSGKRQRGG